MRIFLIFFLPVALILFFSPGFSEEEERVSVLLPSFSGLVIFTEDEEGNKIRVQPPPREGKFAELYVRPRLNPDNPEEFYIPDNFYEAVRELKQMLPPDYLEFVLAVHGYVKSMEEATEEEMVRRPLTEGVDNRILDLNAFLTDIWQLAPAEDHALAKQISCMGDFEFQMPALYISFVLQEILDEGGTYTYDMYEAVYLTRRLEVQCLAE